MTAKNYHRTLTPVLTLLALMIFSTTILKAAPGELDPTFGNGGKVVTSFGSGDDQLYAVALQSDGKIVAAGWSFNSSTWDIALARYNADGSLDPTFGNGGKVLTDVGFGEGAYAVALQSDGKIVAAGEILEGGFVLARYHPDGTRDNSFGTRGDGIVSTGIGEGYSGINAITIQPDGKIIAVGWANVYPWSYTAFFALARYNTNGTLDLSFGNHGIVTTGFTSNESASPLSAALQSDGRIVAAGVVSEPDGDAYALARYNSNGSLDNSFGTGGKVITYLDGDREAAAYSVAIQPDGKLVAAGFTHHEPGVVYRWSTARYNTSGSLDTTFGAGGVVRTLIGDRGIAAVVLMQSNGKIVEIGGTQDATSDRFAVARYDLEGLLDNSFGTGGIVVTPSRAGGDTPFAGLIQANGKIVAAGPSYNGKNYDFALARYLDDSMTRNRFDFDGDGSADISVFRPASGSWYLQQSTAGFAAVSFGNSTDVITPADFDRDGKTDIAVYRAETGTWYWLNSSNGAFNAVQFGTSQDLPTPADFDGDGKADVGVYRPSNGTWYRLNSSNGSFYAVQFGASEDKPMVGDFDGDGKADVAVFRPSNGAWYRLNSSNGQFVAVGFGLATDLISPADFDGDGKTDVAVYRPSNGTWYSLNSLNGSLVATQFGTAEDIPTAADYDGDGKADIALFRPSNGVWYRLNSGNGAFLAVQFGTNGDRPTPAAFRY